MIKDWVDPDHFVADMPQVYATPMTIPHMETASGAAIASRLPEGFVSVGMDVETPPPLPATAGRPLGPRHFARRRRSTPRAWCLWVEPRDGGSKIGDGTHRRGIVNVTEFEKRCGVEA